MAIAAATSAATLAVRRRSSRSRTKPSHQNEIANLPHPKGRKTFSLALEALESSDQPRSEPVRNSQRTALSLTIPLTLLAFPDEVIE